MALSSLGGPIARATLLFVGGLAFGCGAGDARSQSDTVQPEAVQPDPAPSDHTTARDTAPDAIVSPEAPRVETEPPEPEPVVVEAGVRLGPIRIGMSEAEVVALGLEASPVDSQSRRFGPYRVFFDEGEVRRVEAQLGALSRIRYGDDVFDTRTHIHRLRDAFEDCQWVEGGGERYRCANGTLFVSTTHSMASERYTIAVERP